MTRSWTLRILLPIVIFLICLCSLAANSAVYKDCDDVACAKDCKRVELSGQCPYCRCKEDKDKICKRPLDEGKGLSHHTRYYFYDGRCKEFSYKGEEGNRNNFETKEDCIDYCGADECDQLNCEPNCRITVPLHGCPYCDCEDCDPVVCDESDPDCEKIIPEKGCAFCKCKNHKCDPLTCGDGCKPKYESGKCPVCDCSSNKYVCGLPADKGSGYSYLIRYYHEHGECKTFIYSGKGGNANKFKSKEDCDDFCGVTSCLSLRCEHGCEEEKVHSGCPKKCVCEDRYKICQMPVMEGFGYENQKRYYFDRKYGVCDIFYYKGKGGNYNNFDSKDYCQEYCEHFKSSEVCTLNSDPGSCEKYEKRYYYDYKTYTCKEFNYGGCYGNGNNFKTKEECDKLCIVDEDVCNMPKLVGPCFGSHRKHYYNPQFDQCEVFYYGGCYGNKNRFDSKEECESRCRKYTNICDLDLDKGSCNGQHLRYYYNKDDGKCQEFYYGGCDGNQNNFGTKYDCEHKCEKNVNFCKLSPESGPCYGQIKRYYYDEKARECLMFQYGGCEGNDNNFVSKDQCENKCMDKERVCQMKPDKGPCHEKYKRYYYSPLLGRCETFYYGGCEGNENNFEYKNECEKRCIHEVVDSCILPPEKGPCHGFIEKYYFNKFTKTCEKFYYGGCYGNKNNFDDMESCERKCGLEERVNVCELKVNKGPCEANIKRYYFNKYTRLCESFYYGGCEGNGNNFESIEYCQRACQTTKKVCELKQDKGPCHGNVRRYYFNYYTKKCEKFSYGGCEGNSNNFKTRKDCQYQCVGDYKQSEDVCQLKPYKGPCYKKLDRYYYDDYTKSCKKFVYGGCDGNGNNFETLKDCRYKCGRDSNSRAYGDQPYEDVCQLKPYKGPCYKKLDRYYYDDYSKSCKKFVYGGCDGNGNNFETLEDCRYKCGRDDGGYEPSEDVCQLKPYKGPCYKKLDRYYYDDYTKSCKKFVYGGCDGNGNNFETLQDCRYRCRDNSRDYSDQISDVCQLKHDKGPCYRQLDRYYYDDYTKSCKKFVYGGCDGNGNNFETLEDCRYKCGRDDDGGYEPSEDVCQLKPYKGPCYKNLDRYYYDDYTKSCKKFVYGGCDGNGNNFETLEDCRYKCSRDGGYEPSEDVCELKPHKGSCHGRIKRYYYSPKTGTCEMFVYGGCDGNGNNYETKDECEYQCAQSDDVCDMRPDKGPCYDIIKSYYYNTYSGDCELFYYGGCGGNGNRFATKYQCENKCVKDSDVCPALKCGPDCWEVVLPATKCPECMCPSDCTYPVGKGYGSLKLKRYYFDSKSGSCKKFYYGGKGGNKNNFKSQKSCTDNCEPEIPCEMCPEPVCEKGCWLVELNGYCPQCACPRDCLLDKDVGRCRGKLDRYYWNKAAKKCERFFYGGCEGNNNHFYTYNECQNRCASANYYSPRYDEL